MTATLNKASYGWFFAGAGIPPNPRGAMPKYYEIYDNEEVQLSTRRQVGRLAGYVVLAASATVALVATLVHGILSLLVVAPLLAAIWGMTSWITFRRFRTLRCIVWCVKLSDNCVLGYNYARCPTVLGWNDIDFVNFTQKGVFIHGSGDQLVHITDVFPEYADLAHRILALAEDHGAPIFVDDEPLEKINVYRLFPFLTSASQSPC